MESKELSAIFPVDPGSSQPFIWNATSSPLHISGKGWSLNFQELPQPKVIRRGRVPTLDEAKRSIAYSPLPAIFALLIPIIAASVPAED